MKSFITQFSEGEIREMFREEIKIALNETSAVTKAPLKEIINIKEACELTDLARPTIYGLVSKREIPFFKQGQKLRFKRSELIAWIESGRVMTRDEIRDKVDEQCERLKISKEGRSK